MTTTPPLPEAAPRVQIQSVAAHLFAIILSAVLLGLSFPEPGWGLLAHFALVPACIVAIRSACARRLAWTSYLVSLVWWLWVIRWLSPVTGGGYVALCAYLAIYFPLALLCIRWLAQHPLTVLTLAVPAVWTSLELVRGNILAGGFSWFALAHTQVGFRTDQSSGLICQTADLFGEQTVSFIVGATNGLILDWMTRPWVIPSDQGRRFSKAILLATFLWVILLPGAIVYGLYRTSTLTRIIESGTYPDLRVAVVQTNVPQDNKINPTPEKQEVDWQRLISLTKRAGESSSTPPVHLIVWPETVTPSPINPGAREYFSRAAGYYEHSDSDQSSRYKRYLSYHTQISKLAADLDTALVVGGSAYEFADPLRRYNAAYLYYPTGHQADQRYNKIHRVPFGEYIPWVDSWPWLKNQFMKYLSPYEVDYTLQPGDTPTVFELPIRHQSVSDRGLDGRSTMEAPPTIVRIGPSICFEDTVARVTRRMAYDENGKKRIDLLVNLTNDGWYSGNSQRQQHLQVAVLRSIENRVPTARAVNTGISGFIDSTGRIGPLVRTDDQTQHVDGVEIYDIQFDPRSTLYGRLGSRPIIILAIVTAIWLYAACVRPMMKSKLSGTRNEPTNL